MKTTLLLLIFMFFSLWGSAQEEKIYFSEAISMYLDKYEEKAEEAYRLNNTERAEFLFDSLVDFCLKGSYLDNFKVKDLDKKDVFFNDFEKPVYLITYSSSIVTSKGQVSAINKLAEQFQNEIKFVILYWDSYKTTKALAEQYSDFITILYVDETRNQSSHVVRLMKHSLGFPTCFLLDSSQQIIDVKRSISLPYNMEFQKVFDLNFNSISEGVSLLLLENSSSYTHNEKHDILP